MLYSYFCQFQYERGKGNPCINNNNLYPCLGTLDRNGQYVSLEDVCILSHPIASEFNFTRYINYNRVSQEEVAGCALLCHIMQRTLIVFKVVLDVFLTFAAQDLMLCDFL